jgi:hypothetical protein
MEYKKLNKILGIFFLILACLNVYYFGDDPNNHRELFVVYISAYLLFFLYLIFMTLIRKIFRGTSSIWVRDALPGAQIRANSLVLYVLKTIFWSNWWIACLVFLFLYPVASALKAPLFLLIYIICFLILDFTARQISLNWFWKNRTDHLWKYNSKDQFTSIFKHLVLSPAIIIFLYIFDFSLYTISETFTENREGWIWYIFSFFGFVFLYAPIFNLIRSIFDPEESITQLTEDTYDN